MSGDDIESAPIFIRFDADDLEHGWGIRHTRKCLDHVDPWISEDKARACLRDAFICRRLGCQIVHRYLSPWEDVDVEPPSPLVGPEPTSTGV